MRPPWLPVFLGAYLCLCLRLTLAARLEVGGTIPDVLLLFVLYLALHRDAEPALCGAWFTGLLADAAGGGWLGLHGAIYLVLAAGVGRLRDVLVLDRIEVQMVLAGAAGFSACWVEGIFAGVGPLRAVAPALGQALYLAVLGPIFLSLLHVFEGRRRYTPAPW